MNEQSATSAQPPTDSTADGVDRVPGSVDADPSATVEELPDAQRSGLRNPQRASAGLGSIVLGLEALVLLMTIVPLRMLLDSGLGPAIGLVLGLTVVCVVLAGMMRRAWAWHLGTLVQVILVAAGLIHWSLAGVGVIFGATWWYALTVRAKLAKPPVRTAS